MEIISKIDKWSGWSHASHIWVGNCTVLFLLLLQGTGPLETARVLSWPICALSLSTGSMSFTFWCIYRTLSRSRVTFDVRLYREEAVPCVSIMDRRGSPVPRRRAGCCNPRAPSIVIDFFAFSRCKKRKWVSVFSKLVDKVSIPERAWCRQRKGSGDGQRLLMGIAEAWQW